MAILGLIGQKKTQSQRFLEDGRRIPVTLISIPGNKVFAVRSDDKEGYTAIQVGFGIKKHANKANLGHAKKAAVDAAPLYLREISKMEEETQLPNVGDTLVASDIFKEGDIVNVTGVSKGKGFAGVVKRHGFHGGPKTHGQSDRHRAPGAIGQGTTPGRVYKGKRMAGRMGQDTVTISNLVVVQVSNDEILVDGLIPGIPGNVIRIEKVGEAKKFVPLWKEAVDSGTDQSPSSDDAKQDQTVQVEQESASLNDSSASSSDESQNSTEPAVSSPQNEPVSAAGNNSAAQNADASAEPKAEQEVQNSEEAPATQDATSAVASQDQTEEVAEDAKS